MKVSRKSNGFTLIELLVVVLILGILLAIAIPAYLSSIKTARTNAANSNAKAIATAVQSVYVKNGGTLGYDNAMFTGLTGDVQKDLGGSIPQNPCDAGVGIAGYTITAPDATHWSIIGKNTAGTCDTMVAVTFNAS